MLSQFLFFIATVSCFHVLTKAVVFSKYESTMFSIVTRFYRGGECRQGGRFRQDVTPDKLIG